MAPTPILIPNSRPDLKKSTAAHSTTVEQFSTYGADNTQKRRNINFGARFVVLTEATMKITVFRDVTSLKVLGQQYKPRDRAHRVKTDCIINIVSGRYERRRVHSREKLT
jgi:hypothetical protein